MCLACKDKEVKAAIDKIMDDGREIAGSPTMDLYGKFFALATAAASLVAAAAAAANVARENDGEKPVPIEQMSEEIMELMLEKIRRAFQGVDQAKMNEDAKAAADAMRNGVFH